MTAPDVPEVIDEPPTEAMIYTICPVCGSVLADAARHMTWHVSQQPTEGTT